MFFFYLLSQMEVGILRLKQEENDFKASLGYIMKPSGEERKRTGETTKSIKFFPCSGRSRSVRDTCLKKQVGWLLRKDAQGWPSAFTCVYPQDHTNTNKRQWRQEWNCSVYSLCLNIVPPPSQVYPVMLKHRSSYSHYLLSAPALTLMTSDS